ncbi:hypothetical protein DAPPUDRAFT_269075 [Daphnia pulex]|uniref:Uncharacterized protein n=1 Tax=Daphnia pulex TaxID=6669 RepID=E9HYS8_DAPPU|nr:hypothetical protein DAPPUDRAFT_269075 [Daphnia pulex]|eukprot:EFX63102.1 hypothetical protein DAPPUDRAFT_269075 [Daphnia pulex]
MREYLINCETSAAMWTRLSTRFTLRTIANKGQLWSQFYEYQFNQSQDMLANITSVENLVRQLKDLEETITEVQTTNKILTMADQEHGQHVDAGQLGEDVRQLGHGAEQIEVPPPLIHVGNECFQYQAGLCKVEPPGHEPDVDIPFNVPQNVPSQCASVPPPLIV